MLIMKCSKCDKYIESELLVELSSITCEHCGTDVAVKNVLVSSNGFTFDREDLLRRFFRYRKLLDEVIDERNSLHENTLASKESKQSINQFLGILQGMMTGARDNYRCQFSGSMPVEIAYNRNKCLGAFVNLSMEGACIDLPCSNPLPRVASKIALSFSLPGAKEMFNINGSICWVQQGKKEKGAKHVVGMKFEAVNAIQKEQMWEYIVQQARGDKS